MNEEYREEGASQFSLQSFFYEIKKRLLLIIAVTLLCTAVGGVVGAFFVKPQYKSTATLIVTGEGMSLSEAQSLATAMKSFLDPENDIIYKNTYGELETKSLDESVSITELKYSLAVKVNSMMINLEYESTNVEADTILNTIIVEFRKFIDQTDANEPIKKVEVDGEMIEKPNYIYDTFGGKLQVLSYASDPTNDSKLLVFKYMALFFIIGAIGTVLAVLLKVMLNDTYSDKETLQNDIGIDVLVMIEDVISVKKESK